MAERRALLIATDTFHQAGFGPVPCAEASALALSEALLRSGIAKPHQTLLLNQSCTKSSIESRVRKFRQSARAGDTLIVFLRGLGLAEGRFLAWDTWPDDLGGTSVSLSALVKDLAASKAAEVILLLDLPGLRSADVEAIANSSAKLSILTSCDEEETSPVLSGRNASAWVVAITEALQGRAAKAATAKHLLTAASLQKWLTVELPRLLRQHGEGKVKLTPQLFGNPSAVLADLSPFFENTSATLDAERLKRIVFRADRFAKVRDLAGFRRTYRMPESAGPAVQKFIARCASEEIAADLAAMFELARVHFAYRRKDIHSETDGEGRGTVRTPGFEYAISLRVEAEDPSRIRWRRELGQLADPGFLRSKGFAEAFGNDFDQLAFEFGHKIDVPALVDRLEDDLPAGAKLHVENDGEACELRLKAFDGRIRVESHELVVLGRLGNPAGLIDALLAFLSQFGNLGEERMLKG